MTTTATPVDTSSHETDNHRYGISVQPATILQITKYRPRVSFWGTTWALLELHDGSVDEVVLEQVFDLETQYPLDHHLDGISGDYAAFLAAQQGGKDAARRYAARHSENAPGSTPEQYLARLRRLKAIRSRAARIKRGQPK